MLGSWKMTAVNCKLGYFKFLTLTISWKSCVALSNLFIPENEGKWRVSNHGMKEKLKDIFVFLFTIILMKSFSINCLNTKMIIIIIKECQILLRKLIVL